MNSQVFNWGATFWYISAFLVMVNGAWNDAMVSKLERALWNRNSFEFKFQNISKTFLTETVTSTGFGLAVLLILHCAFIRHSRVGLFSKNDLHTFNNRNIVKNLKNLLLPCDSGFITDKRIGKCCTWHISITSPKENIISEQNSKLY